MRYGLAIQCGSEEADVISGLHKQYYCILEQGNVFYVFLAMFHDVPGLSVPRLLSSFLENSVPQRWQQIRTNSVEEQK